MKNTQDDEHSSKKDYSEYFKDIDTLEKMIHQLGGVEAIDFYEYVIKELDDNPSNSDMLWLAAMQLEDIPAVMLYKGNLSEDIRSSDKVDVFANETSMKSHCNELTIEDQEQIDSIVRALEKKRKTNPIKRLLKMIKA